MISSEESLNLLGKYRIDLDKKACGQVKSINLDFMAPVTFGGSGFVGAYTTLHQCAGLVHANLGSYCYSYSLLHNCSVGNYCCIGKYVNLTMQNHPYERISSSLFSADKEGFGHVFFREFKNKQDFGIEGKRAFLGHDIAIGDEVTILGGVSIGHGAVILPGSVVTHNVPPYSVIGGNPGKILAMRFDEETIRRILNTRWFFYDWAERDIKWQDLASSLMQIEEQLNSDNPPPLLDTGFVYTLHGGDINFEQTKVALAL